MCRLLKRVLRRCGEDVFALLEKLGNLRDQGVITPDDFEAKKKELLSRI